MNKPKAYSYIRFSTPEQIKGAIKKPSGVTVITPNIRRDE